MQQFNKTQQNKTLLMTITLLHSGEVKLTKMFLKKDHFYTITS